MRLSDQGETRCGEVAFCELLVILGSGFLGFSYGFLGFSYGFLGFS